MTPQKIAQLTQEGARTIEFWTVQNTGWSSGMSWFDCGGRRDEPARFESERAARDYIAKNRWDDPSVKWRVTHVMIERLKNKRVTTEEWGEVPDEAIAG